MYIGTDDLLDKLPEGPEWSGGSAGLDKYTQSGYHSNTGNNETN